MNVRPVAHVLGSFLVLLGVLLVGPFAFALLDRWVLDSVPGPEAAAFLAEAPLSPPLAFALAALTTAAAGIAMRRRFPADLDRIGARESCAIVTGTWIALAAFGGLPYWFSGVSFTDSYFETMSGFTTTGASVFPVVEALPRPLLLWRAVTQWLGGMGIVVLGIAILPMMGGGASLFKAEAPGGATFEKPVPRIRSVASFLWRIYLLLTAFQILALLLCGMTPFEAICHTAATVSTGGFSTRTLSAAAFGPAVQWVLILFMFLSGMSFLVHRLWLTGKFEEAARNVELRAYAALTGGAVLLTFVVLAATHMGPHGVEPKLRAAAFQTVSLVTTTGFATENYDAWSHGLRMLMFLLLFVGGCTGSTAGAMKVLRHVIFWKATIAELRRVASPRAVWLVKIGGRAVDRDTVSNVLGFGVLYLFVFFVGAFLLALMGLDVDTSLSAAASCLGNVGPGLGMVGPSGNYAGVPMLGKWVLALCMVVGRLEVYSVLVLFLRRTWTE